VIGILFIIGWVCTTTGILFAILKVCSEIFAGWQAVPVPHTPAHTSWCLFCMILAHILAHMHALTCMACPGHPPELAWGSPVHHVQTNFVTETPIPDSSPPM
jgi:hypothetical protein